LVHRVVVFSEKSQGNGPRRVIGGCGPDRLSSVNLRARNRFVVTSE
jgi:hypothetical protein